jgi:site-specific DNA recombinase
MGREKSVARHYLATGVLGAYETAEVMHEEEENVKYAPCFEDATVFFDKTQTTAIRSMCIEGRRFRIRETQLKTIVLDDLKRVTHYARQKEKLFVEHITRKNTAETRQEITRIQREIDAAKRRDGELTALFKRLYEDNVLGRIPNEHFRLLSSEYTTEQAEIRNRLPKLEERMVQLRNSLTNVAQFIDKAKRYSNITELTPEILRLFIEKIVVGEKSQKYSRTAEQDIWIYYRGIGLMDTPVEPETAQEAGLDEVEAFLTDETPAAASTAPAASTGPAA